MNRRDFMGTVVGGIAVAKLGAAGLVGYGADSADLETYQTLDFRMQDARAAFTVPRLNAYCMVAVSW